MIYEKALTFFDNNKQATELFLVLVFFMHRNVLGGLTEYDDMVVQKIKNDFFEIIQTKADHNVLDYLIELINNFDYSETISIISQPSLQFIADQNPISLSKILATYIPQEIGLLVKIPLNNINLEELLNLATTKHPLDLIKQMDIEIANPWHVIAMSAIGNSIYDIKDMAVISFTINKEDKKSFYFLKSLYLLKAFMPNEPKEEEVEYVPPSLFANFQSMGVINTFKSIFSITNLRNKPNFSSANSNPVIDNANNNSVAGINKKGRKGFLSKIKLDVKTTGGQAETDKETVDYVVDKELESVDEMVAVNEKIRFDEDDYVKFGFYDVNSGFFIQVIRKQKVD